MDGQNLLVIFRVNGSIEVANVPGHRHITKGIGQASVVEHLTEQNCWVRVSGSSPLYIFFWDFLPEDLVLANKGALTPVQSSGRQFSSIPGIKLYPKTIQFSRRARIVLRSAAEWGSFQFSSWVFSEPRIILCASCRVLPGELGASSHGAVGWTWKCPAWKCRKLLD